MLRVTLALAIITGLCVLSPVRDSRRDSAAANGPGAAEPAGGESLVARAAGGMISLAGGRSHETAASVAAAREAAATLDGIRRIVAVPQTPLEMPPLRR